MKRTFPDFQEYMEMTVRELRALARERNCNLPRYATKKSIITELLHNDDVIREKINNSQN